AKGGAEQEGLMEGEKKWKRLRSLETAEEEEEAREAPGLTCRGRRQRLSHRGQGLDLSHGSGGLGLSHID
ncbi:hypothetical protein SK128_009168, partial [Halocaridina rubra]